MSAHEPIRLWLSDSIRHLGHVAAVTSSESEALRAVQMLAVDLAIVDYFGLAEIDCSSIVSSLQRLSATQPLPVIEMVGPRWKLVSSEGSEDSHRGLIHVPWPMTVDSIDQAIARLSCDPPHNDRPTSRPS